MKYFIIKNQCPVRGDPSLEVESNGDSLTGRFNIKMFKFLGDDLNDVWLHCTVRACNTTAGKFSDSEINLSAGLILSVKSHGNTLKTQVLSTGRFENFLSCQLWKI